MRKGRLWMTAAATFIFGLTSQTAIASSFKIIYTFQGGNDGAQPTGPLININGLLYGATTYGGIDCKPNGCGTIFSLTTSGTETILYKFKNEGDGFYPFGLYEADNAVIGATNIGSGPANIFSMTTDGKYTVLGKVSNPVWPVDRRALTRVGDTWYGVDGGSQYSNCQTGACGYVFAVQP